MSDELGWVIERDIHSALHYWAGRTGDNWSPIHSDALRFARRTDAELMLTYHCAGIGRVVEHSWIITRADPIQAHYTEERPVMICEGGEFGIDALVDGFCAALKAKMHAAEKKYGYTDAWKAHDWRDSLIRQLHEHIAKGDPRDVAAYCAFAWHHSWNLSDPIQAAEKESK